LRKALEVNDQTFVNAMRTLIGAHNAKLSDVQMFLDVNNRHDPIKFFDLNVGSTPSPHIEEILKVKIWKEFIDTDNLDSTSISDIVNEIRKKSCGG